jgi:hypothetical protein
MIHSFINSLQKNIKNDYNNFNQLSIKSNDKFEKLSCLYEDNDLNTKYNSLIKLYNKILKKEENINQILFQYKIRLLNKEILTNDELNDIKKKKYFRKKLLNQLDEIKIKIDVYK